MDTNIGRNASDSMESAPQSFQLDQIEVVALVGPAGTGKSHRALLLAHQKQADLIIDDGLLIKQSRILAGRSGKSEKLVITATKRALFFDLEHAQNVQEKIQQEQPAKILILGISENMVLRIAQNLNLPEPQEIIHIEKLASGAEILAARRSRMVDKKHAVPVVSVDVSRDSVGQLLDSFTVFFRRKNNQKGVLGENSVVRPRYSVLGRLSIADTVIRTLANGAALEIPEVQKVTYVNVSIDKGQLQLELAITLPYGIELQQKLVLVQQRVYTKVSECTGLEIKSVNVLLKGIVYPPKQLK